MRTTLKVGIGLVMVTGCAGEPIELCEPSVTGTQLVIDAGVACLGSGPCAGATSLRAGQPDPRKALDLVFVAEGFRADELPRFRAHVDGLLESATQDHDSLVARAAPQVNAFLIELESQTHEVTDAETRDTALGGCLAADELSPAGTPMLTTRDRDLPARLAAALVPQADAVVVIINSGHGRANATFDGTIFMNLADDGRTLSHELGHAVLGLGDEYSDTERSHDGGVWTAFRFRYPGVADVPQPNLSVDPSGGKWRGLVDSVVEGGARYKRGIFHPTERCRMNRSSDPFCPVCAAEAAAFVLPFRGVNDGPPRCHLESTASLTPFHAPLAFLQAPCTDANGFSAMTVSLDGRTMWTLAPFLETGFPDPTGKSRSWTGSITIGFEPPEEGSVPLDAGEHTVTVTAEDTLGAKTTFEHRFVAGRP